jgi:hypothetical protein
MAGEKITFRENGKAFINNKEDKMFGKMVGCLAFARTKDKLEKIK